MGLMRKLPFVFVGVAVCICTAWSFYMHWTLSSEDSVQQANPQRMDEGGAIINATAVETSAVCALVSRSLLDVEECGQMHHTDIPLLLTGPLGSNLQYVAEVLLSLGLDVSNDDGTFNKKSGQGSEAVVSWVDLFAPRHGCQRPYWAKHLHGHRFKHMVLVVREPLKMVALRAAVVGGGAGRHGFVAKRAAASLRDHAQAWVRCNVNVVSRAKKPGLGAALSLAMQEVITWWSFGLALATDVVHVEELASAVLLEHLCELAGRTCDGTAVADGPLQYMGNQTQKEADHPSLGWNDLFGASKALAWQVAILGKNANYAVPDIANRHLVCRFDNQHKWTCAALVRNETQDTTGPASMTALPAGSPAINV